MAWVMPVGAPGGNNSGFADIEDGSGMVRLGEGILILAPESYQLWRWATTVPEVDELLALADQEGFERTQSLVEGLIESGLMIRQAADVRARMADLSISVVGDLLGNGSDPRGFFVITGRTGARVDVAIQCFEVLLRSDGTKTVGAICGRMQDALEAAAPRPILEYVCDALPVLVRNDIVRLNRPIVDERDG
jgi:hypothetical protein